MKPCKFTFDDTPAFDGFAHGSKWNGFDNVAVTPEVRFQIMQYFDAHADHETADDINAIEVGEDGLISLGWGYCTQIVDKLDYQDVLDELAYCDGACLYWQMTDVKLALFAVAAGFVKLDPDTDLLIHPDAREIDKGMLYTMKKD